MNKWEEFEIDCTKFLTEHFGEYATFTHHGESNSNIPDIEVVTNKNKQFYIEAKYSPAQCGQFVLFADEKTQSFTYSTKNKSTLNEFSQKIIEYMNNNFTCFLSAGTRGREIEIDNCEDLFANWIIDKYTKMNVKYIITNNFIILELKDLLKYFKIKSKYRIKKSGSSNPAKKDIIGIGELIKNTYNITKYNIENKKMFINSKENLDKQKFKYGEYSYQFSKIENRYEIRKLSNTFNANVIFSIELKTNIDGISLSDFIFILMQD